jgi:tetratricopeptide (TPR) repeat protein
MSAHAGLVIALVGALGCGRPAPRPPGPVASALVGLSADLGATPGEIADAWARLEAIAARIEARRRETRTEPIDALNAVVFGELGFEREIESGDVRFFRLPSVLADRRGSCLGLGDLYLVLGERLGVPLDGIMVPGHFFVCSGDGRQPRNVELLRRGEAMPDAWYRGKYGPWPPGGAEYFRPLSIDELVAVHWFDTGNQLRAARDLAGAERAYARAAAAFPAFAEAHASLGAVRQLKGDLREAQAAYDQAARARSDLPGLEENVTLLKREESHDIR